ncbi:hypothetical protein Pelo_1503 [Pelomyxa schiedti]|nr:hypothetical protein Pelo_1503 [Pelomyxa schiedti]
MATESSVGANANTTGAATTATAATGTAATGAKFKELLRSQRTELNDIETKLCANLDSYTQLANQRQQILDAMTVAKKEEHDEQERNRVYRNESPLETNFTPEEDIGSNLNIMFIGMSGSGKTSLIQSLLLRNAQADTQRSNDPEFNVGCQNVTALLDKKRQDTIQDSTKQPTPYTAVITLKNDTKLHLHILDIPGMLTEGLQLPNVALQAGYELIEQQLLGRWLKQEREKIFHIVFYLLLPHRILGSDIPAIEIAMRYATVIPILAKADAYSPKQIELMKEKVWDKLHALTNTPNIKELVRIFAVSGQERDIPVFGGHSVPINPWDTKSPWDNINLLEHIQGYPPLKRASEFKYDAWLATRNQIGSQRVKETFSFLQWFKIFVVLPRSEMTHCNIHRLQGNHSRRRKLRLP